MDINLCFFCHQKYSRSREALLAAVLHKRRSDPKSTSPASRTGTSRASTSAKRQQQPCPLHSDHHALEARVQEGHRPDQPAAAQQTRHIPHRVAARVRHAAAVCVVLREFFEANMAVRYDSHDDYNQNERINMKSKNKNRIISCKH